jgi:hypothetical protein
VIEWDTNVPSLDVLLEEASRADALLDRADQKSDDHAYAS